MEIKISKEEYNIIYNYIQYQKSSPCDDCRNRSGCCGCPRQREFDEQHKEIIDSYNKIHDGKTIYSEIVEDVHSKMSTYIGLKNAYEKVSKNLNDYKNRLNTEDTELFNFLQNLDKE